MARQIVSIWQIDPVQVALPNGLSSVAQLVAIAPLLLRYHDNFSHRIDRVIDLSPQLSGTSEQIWQTLMLGEILELALENQPPTQARARLSQMPSRYAARFSPGEAPQMLPLLPSAYQTWLQTLVLPSADTLLTLPGEGLKPDAEIPFATALSRCLSYPEGYCTAVSPLIESADGALAMLTGLMMGAFGGLATLPAHRQLAADSHRTLFQTIANRLFREWAGIQPDLEDTLGESAAVFPLL